MGYVLTMALLLMLALASPAFALTRCDLKYDFEAWSVFYKEATGSGVVRCENGQEARVVLETRGGGVTFGRSSIVRGHGHFSPVADIREIIGNYASAEAHAGLGVSSGAQVVTKGAVSLTLSGTGNGVDLGFAFGRFTITRASRNEREEDLSDHEPRTKALPPEDGY